MLCIIQSISWLRYCFSFTDNVTQNFSLEVQGSSLDLPLLGFSSFILHLLFDMKALKCAIENPLCLKYNLATTL